MGNVVSHVPELLEERGWTPMDLVRRTELSLDTAYRLARGNTIFTTKTLEQLCSAFGVKIDEIIEFVPEEQSV